VMGRSLFFVTGEGPVFSDGKEPVICDWGGASFLRGRSLLFVMWEESVFRYGGGACFL